jgi:ABC-type nitrate/sulfonate/bicarbonate transport system substrate-binding protein
MKTNQTLKLTLTCLSLALVLILSSTQRALAGAAPMYKMTTAYTTVGGIITPFWISYEKGLFQKYGLDMGLKFISSGPVIVSAVVAGDIDITSTGPEQFVSAILEGADLTIIGFLATTTPLMLYAQPNITRVEQLKGGTAAVSRLTSSAAYMLKVGLRQAGLESMKDVTVIQAGGIPEAFAALQAGKVQGAMLSPPTTYKAEAAGFKRLWSGLGVEFPSVVLGTRKSFLRSSEDVAARFLQATSEGVHVFKTDKEEALKVMSKYTKVTERKVLEDTYNDNKDVHTVTLQPTTSGIKTILETLSVSNPKAATAKPEDFIDPRSVRRLEDSGFFKKFVER